MRKKKVLAVGVLLAGIGCSAYLLFYNSGVGATSPTITGSGRSGDNFINLIETTNLDVTDPSLNITDEVAKEYTKKIVQMNAGGQGNTANITLPDATAFEAIVKDYLSKNIQFKEYTDKDIRLLNDDSIQTKKTYFENLQKIQIKLIAPLKTNFVYAAALFVTDKKSDELQKHINAASAYITSILETSVPKSAKQFHIDLLNVYEKRRILGTTLLENPDDPLKSVVVLQEMEKLNEEEINLADSFKLILAQ